MSNDGPDNHERVFDWLGADKKGTPYHLHPLNLVWSEDGVDHDLRIYRGVAARPEAEPGYWAAIIREPNWRYTLVGCMRLLVVRQNGFFDDLSFRYAAGSMVVPQLAVTMGLLNPERATSLFRKILADPTLRKQPSRAVSADRALVKLGIRRQPEVGVDEWNRGEKDDASLAGQVFQEQWAFWSERM